MARQILRRISAQILIVISVTKANMSDEFYAFPGESECIANNIFVELIQLSYDNYSWAIQIIIGKLQNSFMAYEINP